ncbi:MAG: hypothetical protein JWN45_1083, partial [Acidobacteriaceae bacterium]|nr:hypothetical protein [Acidobacteriaceae bacterium]
MTAEVAVLNRNAIALAADSAVTLRLPEGPKIYRTNKLFAISKYQPVAVMLFGSADFLGVPWETIIKSYRAELGTRAFPTVQDYGDDFLNFVERKNTFFPPRRQEASCYGWVRGWLRRLKRRLRNALEDRLREKSPLTEAEARHLFGTIFAAEESHLSRQVKLPNFKNIDVGKVRRKYRNAVAQA